MTNLPTTMHALMLTNYSGPGALELQELPMPQPGANEVLIKIAAAPINPSDLMFLQGLYGVHPELPHVAGFEGSGVVVAAGPGLYGRALVGRRVAATSFAGGTWAEYVVCPVTGIVPLLPSVSLPQGAMLFVNPLTAYALVDIARKQGAQAMVQTAAASSLGRMIVRVCQRFKLPLINIVRREEQVAQLQTLGATHILNSSTPDFDAQLKVLCRELKATVAVDAVAGALTGRLLAVMPRGTQVYVYGALDLSAIQLNPGDLIFRNQQVGGFYLGTWVSQLNPAELLRAAVTVQQLMGRDFRSEVRAALPLTHHARALALYAGDMTGGKVLFMPRTEG